MITCVVILLCLHLVKMAYKLSCIAFSNNKKMLEIFTIIEKKFGNDIKVSCKEIVERYARTVFIDAVVLLFIIVLLKACLCLWQHA